MFGFLFWNIAKRELSREIVDLVRENQVDVLMLAESTLDPQGLAAALRAECSDGYRYCPGLCKYIHIYSSLPDPNITVLREGRRHTLRSFAFPDASSMTLGVVHLPSQRECNRDTLKGGCNDLAMEVCRVEDDVAKHRRTILVGDFNLNPFDGGLVGARALNAVMSREVAMQRERQHQSARRRYFYNPTWNLLGDRDARLPGTFYRQDGNDECYYWNLLDQVLLRPEVLDIFDHDSLRVVETVGTIALAKPGGGVRKPSVSDHLPLFFRLMV